MKKIIKAAVCIFILVACCIVLSFACNEAICGSRVSKCMLIQSCNCSMTPEVLKTKNCTCCKECHLCLDDLYPSCCSCVGMCPSPKDMDPLLTMKSYVEELNSEEDQTEMFSLLTEESNDTHGRWTTFSFPALETAFFYHGGSKKLSSEVSSDAAVKEVGGELDSEPIPEFLKGLNCTVAFMSACASLEKCRLFCQSMGASSYRWFHNGCCECVGKTCLNYGLREAKCSLCSDDGVTVNPVTEKRHMEDL